MLKILFGTAFRVNTQQHLTIIFPALIFETAFLIHQIKHNVDALNGIVVPSRKHQQMRAFGNLRLIPCDRLDTLAHLWIGDDNHFVRLQAA